MPHSRTIRAERHEDLQKLILRDLDALVERWSQRALQEQAGARGLHHEALLDHLPALLKALAVSLGESDPDGVGRHRLPAIQHGEQRWNDGWSLPDVVRDYQLLRTVLFDHLSEVMERPLRLREVLAINLAIDEAISASVGMYVASREESVRQQERDRAAAERQVEEDRLRQLADAYREVDRRKDEFLAVLGHELRNPLAPIRNVLQVLQLKAPDGETLAWARGVVERQVRHMTRLVDDLLDVTRIGRSKIQLRQERLDLVPLVRSTVEDHRAPIEGAGLQLELDVPQEPIWVAVDQVRIGQIVGNLLHNAMKFTPHGGQIRVQVRLALDVEQAFVTVRDSGIGIDAEELPHVFETFRQAERSRHQSQGGLGLGLALVKGLVELHGGGVAATSHGPGTGSEFAFWLPLAQ